MAKRALNCCDGFTRSASMRAALARGRGASPREWDPRMPLPAGASIDRRRFLLGAAGGLMSVYGAGRLGLGDRSLAEGIAQAATLQGRSSPVLVSIFLTGGIDALSVLAPTEDPTYRKLRPTLAVSPADGTPFREDPALSWGPAAAAFGRLHDAGKVTVFPGIGYTDPDMSHFTSRHYWEVGAADTRLVTGWLGRYLDIAGSPTNPLQGLSMDGEMNPTLATARNPVAAIDGRRASRCGSTTSGATCSPRRSSRHRHWATPSAEPQTRESLRWRRPPPRSAASAARSHPSATPTATLGTPPRSPTQRRRPPTSRSGWAVWRR
jgi:hypothetical protein